MSGGHFNYEQYKLQMIADDIEQLIIDNKEDSCYSDKTIKEFKAAVALLKVAHVYVQRIDWLVSGDDGEDSFHSRLIFDLEKLQNV